MVPVIPPLFSHLAKTVLVDIFAPLPATRIGQEKGHREAEGPG